MENYDSEMIHDSQSVAFDVAPSLWVDTGAAAEPAAPSIKRPELPPSDPLGVRNLARREFEKQHTQLNLFTQGVDSPKRYAKKRVDWDQHTPVQQEQPRFTRANVQAQPTPSRAPWGTDDDDTVITKFSTRKFHLY